MFHEAIVCGRFFGEHVQGRASYLARLKRPKQRFFVDYATPGAIYYAYAVAHGGEGIVAHHAAGVVGERGVHGQKISPRVHFCECRQLHAQPGGALLGEKRIVGHYLHLQAASAIADDGAYVSKPHHAQGLAAELGTHKVAASPVALPERGVGLRYVAGQCHHQRHGVLGGGDVVAPGRVHDDHSAARGLGHVYVVHPYARAAHDLELCCSIQQLGRDARTAAYDQAVGVGYNSGEIFGRQAGLVVQQQARRGLEYGQALGRQLVRNNNLADLGHAKRTSP